MKPTGGRPTKFTAALAETLCIRIGNGESLRYICSEVDMPGKSTVMRWLADNEVFRDQYARSREVQADHFADEILDIADNGTNDYVERNRPDGSLHETVNTDHINRSRLRVDTRKWLMARMAPKKYGDRVVTEHSGIDGKPIEQRLEVMWKDPE